MNPGELIGNQLCCHYINKREKKWEKVGTDNIHELADVKEFDKGFLRLFGFGIDGVDYQADLDPDVPIDLG